MGSLAGEGRGGAGCLCVAHPTEQLPLWARQVARLEGEGAQLREECSRLGRLLAEAEMVAALGPPGALPPLPLLPLSAPSSSSSAAAAAAWLSIGQLDGSAL